MLFTAATLFAQTGSKMNLALRMYLQQEHHAKQSISLTVFGSGDAICNWVVEHQGHCRPLIHGALRLQLPLREVRALAQLPYIERIVFESGKGMVLNDSMLVNNRVLPIHAGAKPLHDSLRGKGVIIGFIDTGIDFTHPDFQDSTGQTRVLAIWDQGQDTIASSRIPQPYNYGQEWDSTDINAGICTHDDDVLSHGTNVAGIATGNGLAVGRYMGVAPEADIIAVATDFSSTDWLNTVADGVEYIFNKADALGRPCVVNISAGTYLGSHDGSDIAAQRIDSMLKAKKGRALVCAAGNLGNVPFHLGYPVTSDTLFTWFTYNAAINGVFFELWADTADFNQVDFAIGADQVTPSFSFRGRTAFDRINNRLNVLHVDSIMSGPNRIARVETWAERIGDKFLMQVFLPNPDSSQYHFRFMTTGSGRFDCWSHHFFGVSTMVSSGLPAVAVFPDMVNYRKPDTLSTLVSSFACLPSTITVANYVNRDRYEDVDSILRIDTNAVPGAIAANSCLGPTRKGLHKPDVAATGDMTLSANRLASIPLHIANNQSDRIGIGGMHKRNGGTSMAAPVVAGIVALYFEQCGLANYQEVGDAIRNAVYADTFATALPNFKWGYGKVDGYASLLGAHYQPAIYPGLDNVVCRGDSIMLNTAPGYSSYLWSNGDTLAGITVDSSLVVTLTTFDSSGCKGVSDTAVVVQEATPGEPDIQGVNNMLYTTASAVAYQWYLEGVPVSGEVDSTITISKHGVYQVEVFNEAGCSVFSDSLIVDWPLGLDARNINELLIYPNPSQGRFMLQSAEALGDDVQLLLVNGIGQVLPTEVRKLSATTLEINVLSAYRGICIVKLNARGKQDKYQIAIY